VCTEEHCGVLSDLMCELVELTQAEASDGNECSDVAVEATRCLGVVGIIDIGLVMPRGRPANVELKTAVSTLRDSAKMQQYSHMFHALADYLTDSESVFCVF